MSRYTKAYSAFKVRISEVETLRHLASIREKEDPITLRNEINALTRGSIVLLSSHLEAYIKELGEIALDSMHKKSVLRDKISPQLYYHISKDLIDELKDTTDPERIGEKVFPFFESDAIYWSRTGIFPQPIPIDRFNKGFSNPAFNKIRKYLNRFGYSSYRSELKSSLKGTYQPTINLIDHLVDTRNKIAHGDPEAKKTPTELISIMNITSLFCRETDHLFANWWKTNFCTIR